MDSQQPAAIPLGESGDALTPGKRIFESWIKRRVRRKRAPTTLPFELQYKNIFVLPTLFGFGFGVMLVFMALGGLNFNNNMALILVFLLATIAQLSTFIAYRNLSGLRIDGIVAKPVFCTQAAKFKVFVASDGGHWRFAVQAGFDTPQACRDIAPGQGVTLLVERPTTRRGWLKMPSFKLENRFPFGLFKAWSWVFADTQCLVYPTPARNAPPLPKTGRGHSGLSRKGDGDQVHGLRKYQPGDSLQRIAWRASARHDELYALEMEVPQEEACQLDWFLLAGLDVETRLSILTAWVIEADRKHLAYGLNLPGRRLPPGHGAEHRLQCLEMLALYEQ